MKQTTKTLAKKLAQTITVKRNEIEPENIELIAASILDSASAFKRALAAGLKRETIVTLIHDKCTSTGRPAIREVLNVAEKLGELHLTRKQGKA